MRRFMLLLALTVLGACTVPTVPQAMATQDRRCLYLAEVYYADQVTYDGASSSALVNHIQLDLLVEEVATATAVTRYVLVLDAYWKQGRGGGTPLDHAALTDSMHTVAVEQPFDLRSRPLELPSPMGDKPVPPVLFEILDATWVVLPPHPVERGESWSASRVSGLSSQVHDRRQFTWERPGLSIGLGLKSTLVLDAKEPTGRVYEAFDAHGEGQGVLSTQHTLPESLTVGWTSTGRQAADDGPERDFYERHVLHLTTTRCTRL